MIQAKEPATARSALHVVGPNENILGTLRILAGAEPTRGLYLAFESETSAPSTADALDVHAHAEYDESEYVLTGTREIVIEEQRWEVDSGFFALAPRHARHGMRTVGATPSRWIHFFSPAQIEGYFLERERLREQGVSADQLRALSKSYGVSDDQFSGEVERAYVSPVRAHPDGVVVSGPHTRNAYALVEPAVLPHQEHAHADQEEAFYVLSGELAIEIDGEMLTVPTSSFVLVPRGLRRRHIATESTRALAIYSPGHAIPH
jgi:quercetin dioxygenase-like cupin family protein